MSVKVGQLGEAMLEAGVKRMPLADDRLRMLAMGCDTPQELVRRLEDDPEAALCLFTADEIITHARRYLSALKREQELRPNGGHRVNTNGQVAVTAERTQATRDSGHRTGAQDPGHISGTAGASSPERMAGQRLRTSSLTTSTRHLPGHAKQHSPEAQQRVAAVVGKASLAKSIFDREIGSGHRKLGDLTRFEVERILRRSELDAGICKKLLALPWPDDQVTCLREMLTEQQVTELVAEAYDAFDEMKRRFGFAA